MSGEYMTGKGIVNLIRQLRENGMSDTKILDLIEYIETHDPKEQKVSSRHKSITSGAPLHII